MHTENISLLQSGTNCHGRTSHPKSHSLYFNRSLSWPQRRRFKTATLLSRRDRCWLLCKSERVVRNRREPTATAAVCQLCKSFDEWHPINEAKVSETARTSHWGELDARFPTERVYSTHLLVCGEVGSSKKFSNGYR